MTPFPHLFSAFKIGRLTLKNRIVMAPIDTNLADESGHVTDALLAFYDRRAAGGAAMIIVENSQVDYPTGKNTIRQLAIDHKNKIPGLKKLSKALHDHETVAAIQIHHAGRETTLEVTGGKTPVAPSAIPCGHLQTPVRELSRSEIETLIDKFIAAAILAGQANFDLVEIHGAHGYLVGEFLSPYTNRRTDSYGGNFSNRMRFAVEIIHGIKAALGKDFPISFRFSADEFIPGGIALKDGIRIARRLQKAGVDVLHVSAGIYESLPTLLEPMSYDQGWRSYLAASIKQAVDIPVITVGVVREPGIAEQLISEKQADFVAIGRGLLADAEWPIKAEKGRVSEIQRCIGCNEGCLNQRLTKSIQCSVNPETGRELRFKHLPPIKRRKKLLVVGGGPAGLEAARVSAMRGFHVTLFEKEPYLGGQMRLACIPPGKEKITWTIEYYEYQMQHLDVDVHLQICAGITEILDAAPDLAVIATGSTAVKPAAFASLKNLKTPDEILLQSERCGHGIKNVAVIGGGGIGCETALFLKEKELNVFLFEQQSAIALDVEPITAWDLIERVEKAGIKKIVNSRISDIKDNILRVERTEAVRDEMEAYAFDLIVWAGGRKPRQSLVQQIQQMPGPFDFQVIGDAKSVGKIHDAIYDGYAVIAAR
ncbi:MAG: FAD-dependent oxidoreductase [Desulfobacterales bacterium]|jgi:2,4-dienoyl-CoA reductase-like NADH-dependent reductase (Old Yellow Enzyme family)/thioredoxin reductase